MNSDILYDVIYKISLKYKIIKTESISMAFKDWL